MVDLTSIIIAVIAASPGLFALFSQIRKEKREAKIDNVKVAQDAMLSVINPMKDEITRLHARVHDLEELIKTKDDRIDELEKAVDKRDKEIAERNSRIDDLETEVSDLRSRLEIVERGKDKN